MTKADADIIIIKRIKTIAFTLHERDIDIDPVKPVRIEIGHKLSFSFELNHISLTIKVFYFYPEASPENMLASMEVLNTYEIPNLIQYKLDEHQLKLPQETIASIVGLSISHTRSLLAAQLSDSILQDTLLQTVNPYEVAKHFYPYMFNESTEKEG